MRRRPHVPDTARAAHCRSGSQRNNRPTAPRPPRRCTPSAAPTPSADQLPSPGRAGGEGDEFDEDFDLMEDDWDEEEAIEREMLPGGDASEVAPDAVAATSVGAGAVEAVTTTAGPPSVARPTAAAPTAAAAGVCPRMRP